MALLVFVCIFADGKSQEDDKYSNRETKLFRHTYMLLL